MADLGKVDSRSYAAGMASAVWTAVGDAFFRELANHLSAVLGAYVVCVCEISRQPVDRMCTLAASKNGSEDENINYPLADTASAEVVKKGMSIHERGVRRVFPSDPVLEKAGAEAFAGKTLFDSHGTPIGALIAAWRHPLADSSTAGALLNAFAPRAAAELERKRREDALRESEQRYHAFIANNRDSMWRLEFEEPIPTELPEDEQIERMYRYGYLAECNDATARMREVSSPDVLIGSRMAEFAPRTEARIQDLRNVIRSGYTCDNVEIRLTDSRGDPVYRIRSQLGIVENGRLLRVWGTTRDIGELKKAELEWQASERRFRQVLENICMAAVMLDREGRVTFCNDYVLATTGWQRGELLGKDWFEVTVPEDSRERLRAEFTESIAESRVHTRYESVLVARDGTRHVIQWDRTLLRDAEGKVTGTASIGRDVTEQRALAARLNEARRMESVGKFAGGIAHDFNNLLTIIRGYADLLLETHAGGPLHDAASEVVKASELGTALTRHLLAFSRNQPIEARPLILNAVITQNEAMLRRILGGKVELTLELDPSLPPVPADPAQINQVLVNLAINARDAMPQGGRLTISSQTVEFDDIRQAGTPDVPPGTYVALEVADTGAGMTEEVRTHIFEPFFTTKIGRGTGLGLASVYGIVCQSGGYVSVDSAPGKGSKFQMLFPALPGRGAAPRGEPAPTSREEPETILLVDDEDALRGLAARSLRSSGYEVVEAGSGKDALSAAESYPKRIDLLLTDLSMPGMDGSEVAERLRAARPDVKVLFMSGYTDDLPDEPYIQKPFTVRALAEKVRNVLGPGNK